MIISASRRTDIPSFYSAWFFARLKEGYALVRNPMNPRQVARVSLAPDVLDGIVLWTKNPLPMLPRLGELRDIPYYFQFTMTPYGQDMEPGVPPKGKQMIPCFQRLSDSIGPDRVIWRYDPILLSHVYTHDYHVRYFAAMARRLAGYTRRCTISFLDDYRNTARNTQAIGIVPIDEAAIHALAAALGEIARAEGIAIDACAEDYDLTPHGIAPARCVDADLLGRIGGWPLKARKDTNQRKACGCSASIDIGLYNTCANGCLYCYANYDAYKMPRNRAAHDPASPLLIGGVQPDDQVYERAVKSLRG